MIIPDVIRIGSCFYDVEFVDKDLVCNHQECYALIDYNNHIIQISEKLGDYQQQEQSFLHEVLHGIVKDRALEIEDEEFIVDELAKGLHQIILDNPYMFLDTEFEVEEKGEG